MGRGVCGHGGAPAETHPCCAVPQALQRRCCTLSTPAPQILVSLPLVTFRTACGSPVDTTCTHKGQGAHRAGWVSSGPHLGPFPARGMVEAKAVKPKKLLRKLQGRLGYISSRQLKWKLASEVLCLAPPGQVPGFPCGRPGGGTGAVIRVGLPAAALAYGHTQQGFLGCEGRWHLEHMQKLPCLAQVPEVPIRLSATACE